MSDSAGIIKTIDQNRQKHIFSGNNSKLLWSNLIYKRNETILRSEHEDFFPDPKEVPFICYEQKFPRSVAHNSV